MRISSFVRRSSLLSCAFLVGSCAYSTKASFQDITFLSPDAHDAKCLVHAAGVKYQVWPPQTINIKKSDDTMLVVCHAPGNREIEIHVPPRMETVAIWGTPAGMAWDYASNSLFSYPEVIAVDFSQEKLKPFEAPKHNNEDIRQPESYDLEEFLPGDPRLNRDKGRQNRVLKRRVKDEAEWYDFDDSDESEDSDYDDQVVDEETEIMEDTGGDMVEETVVGEVEVEASVVESPEVAEDAVMTPMQEVEQSVEDVLTPITEGFDTETESESVAESEAVEAEGAPLLLVPGE